MSPTPGTRKVLAPLTEARTSCRAHSRRNSALRMVSSPTIAVARGWVGSVATAALLVVEAERGGERVQDVVGRAYLPALFHPLVVVGAQPGQQGQFLAAQAGDLAPAARLQADVAGAQPAAPGPQEITELPRVRMGHAASVPPGRAPKVGLVFLGKRVRPGRAGVALASPHDREHS